MRFERCCRECMHHSINVGSKKTLSNTDGLSLDSSVGGTLGDFCARFPHGFRTPATARSNASRLLPFAMSLEVPKRNIVIYKYIQLRLGRVTTCFLHRILPLVFSVLIAILLTDVAPNMVI